MQHIVRAQYHFHRPVQRQVHFIIVDEHVIASDGVARVQAERIGPADQTGVGAAQLAAGAREAIAPLPLLPEHFELQRFGRRLHVFCVDEQARRKQADNGETRCDDQPAFKPGVFRLIARVMSCAMSEPVHRVRHQQIDSDEENRGDDKGNGKRVIHLLPVGRDGRGTPRADEMKKQRTGDDRNKSEAYGHAYALLTRSKAAMGAAWAT